VFPDCARIGGPCDIGQGRLAPTIALDEFGATLVRWMGVPDAVSAGVNPVELVFPTLGRFASRTLGFMP